jgi:hypothetical protein
VTEWIAERVKAALAYWTLLVAYYTGAVVVAFVLVRWLASGVAAVVLVVQVVLMSAVTLVALMYEEDWWNDFKNQNRGIMLGLLGNVASVLIGVWLAQVL